MAPKGKAKAKAKPKPEAKVQAKPRAKPKAAPKGGAKPDSARQSPEPQDSEETKDPVRAEAHQDAEPVPAPAGGDAAQPAVREQTVAPDGETKAPAGSGVQAVRALQLEGAAAPTEPASAAPEDTPEVAVEVAVEAAVEAAPEKTVAQRAEHLAAVPDPWLNIDEADALQRLQDEEVEVAEAPDAEDREVDCDTPSGCHLLAKDRQLSRLTVTGTAERSIVSLDVSENAFERIDCLPALWLRSLQLSSNPLKSLDSLDLLFPRLLSIDLSFMDLSEVESPWLALSACKTLRCITAEAAGVGSLADICESMPQLRSLDLQDNGIDDDEVEELENLAEHCPGLLRLDLRENPLATASGYIPAVKKCFPKLEWHNNQSQKKSVNKGRQKNDDLHKEVNAVDGLFKNESCSCLEGNPCLEEITCVDWKNRFKVAAEMRKKLGMRDEHGKQL